MIEQRGIMGEGSFVVRYIILNYGTSNFITIKICVTIALLFIPFLILDKNVYWMISGYLGKLINVKAINASPHNIIFSFVNRIFDITFINTPMIFNEFFRLIKLTTVLPIGLRA